ncbi:Exocyst complex protein EXO70 [Escovopsis weberi]|uniref:Exocyst complex protein EXO70 n=1 Tax=Escovopsis weberi TaxID=150374 RepID=A0A0M9VW45_ESCWE|nr:Exocyst complex protein EXO70 [Escovopsis weberi]
MTVGALSQISYHPLDEEARAEVDVLNSRLDKTTQLTKKIQACLGRLETTGQSVRDVVGPLNGETKRLQILGNNVDSVLAAIDRLRQPADSKDDEEHIIRAGPDKAGLSNYLASVKRLGKSYADMQASNLRANQNTMADLTRLIKLGNNQLEGHFDKLLRGETPRPIEPLHFITKDKPFPVISQDKVVRLGLVYAHVVNPQLVGHESPVAKLYADIRGPYLSSSLANLAAASVNTAKKKNPGAIYRTGTNGISTYTKAMEGVDIFANYCLDTLEIFLTALDLKARMLLRGKAVVGVFMANCVVIIERMIRDSELRPLLESRLEILDTWRKKATASYTDICKDLSVHLFDTIHTNRTKRPTSGHADSADSASVVKGLSSKDKDKIKEKFTQFNSAFDDMVSRHKSYNMEPEVRTMFGQDIRQKLQPLYERFWDRYHEIDKGKGKYVKRNGLTIFELCEKRMFINILF